MTGIILAAGMAKRLRPYTNNTPKCLLKVNNKEILYYMLKNLILHDTDHVIIVIGFLKEKIEQFVRQNFPELKVIFVNNDDYSSTNNAYSLLLTEKFIKKDFILLDSDIIFSPRIISLFLKNRKNIQIAVKRHKLTEEEMKVIMDKNNKILSINKWLDIDKSYGESTGIEYFPHSSAKLLFDKLKKRIIKQNRVNEFYEASFHEMIEDSVNFYGVDIGDLEFVEIDYIEDLKKAEKITRNKKIFQGI